MKLDKIRSCLFALLLSACELSGCNPSPDPAPSISPAPKSPSSRSPNAAVLEEATRADGWFHAKKVRPIRARKLDHDETIQTLEGPIEAKAGAYLCRGEAGEPWPQSDKSLHERYDETDDVDAEGWRVFTPHPDAEGVLAAQIDHSFTVQAIWGQLKGKAGDYVVKKFADRDLANPEDVWIVDAKLFQATYAPVTGEGGSQPAPADAR